MANKSVYLVKKKTEKLRNWQRRKTTSKRLTHIKL